MRSVLGNRRSRASAARLGLRKTLATQLLMVKPLTASCSHFVGDKKEGQDPGDKEEQKNRQADEANLTAPRLLANPGGSLSCQL